MNFVIAIIKTYFQVVTLSIDDNKNFLGTRRQVFKRTISWNKYRCKITTQTKSNRFDYLINSTLRNISRLFVLSFENDNDDPTINSFDNY